MNLILLFFFKWPPPPLNLPPSLFLFLFFLSLQVGVSDESVSAVDNLAADPSIPPSVRAAAMRFAASHSETLG